MKEIYPNWKLSVEEQSANCFQVSCFDRDGRKVEHTGTDLENLESRCLSDIKKIEKERNEKELIDSLCDRRDLASLGIIIPGILSQNGLSDGLHEYYDKLLELKQLRRKNLTETEVDLLYGLIELTSENLYPNKAVERNF